jgi:metallophosphoesterase superfamily enzyme
MEEAKMKTSRTTLNYTEKREIDNFLQTVLKKMDNGTVVYINGHSDHTVAKAFGCTNANVAGIRKECFGMLHSPQKVSTDDRIKNIEAFLDDLEPTWRARASRLTSSRQ